MRTYESPIPGDHRWTASVECASGIIDHSVVFYAPPDHGTSWCSDGSVDSDVHEPIPNSAVADSIVRWDEVQPGDLVLHHGRLEVVHDTLPGLHGEDRIGVLISGSWHCPKREH